MLLKKKYVKLLFNAYEINIQNLNLDNAPGCKSPKRLHSTHQYTSILLNNSCIPDGKFCMTDRDLGISFGAVLWRHFVTIWRQLWRHLSTSFYTTITPVCDTLSHILQRECRREESWQSTCCRTVNLVTDVSIRTTIKDSKAYYGPVSSAH